MTTINEPLLPNIGVLALVADEWSAVWQTRHHVLSRLGRYFHVVWVNPALEWRSMLARPKKSGRQNRDTPPSRGVVLYAQERWPPKLYRPEWLARRSFDWRLKQVLRLLTSRGGQKIILYLWRPEFERALLSVPFDLSCYHIDDEYSFSDVDLPVNEDEARLIARVDHVFIHSPGLLEKKGSINPHTTFVPNGVDYQAYANPVPEPLDLKCIPHPRIGYTGVIKRTLDWPLLLHLSMRHPDWHFVFVGPVNPHHRDITDEIQELSKRPNVHFLGAKTTWELAAYPQHFDVCLMPYRERSHSAKYGYPLKLHEYLASGSPTIGTRMRSLEEFGDVVALATSTDEWSAAIAEALSPAANSAERRATRQSIAQGHDWGLLVLQIAKAMVGALGQEFAARLEELLRTVGEPGVSEKTRKSEQACT